MKMSYAACVVTLVLVQFVATAAPSDDAYFSADGVVVAIQGSKDDARMNDPHSMGDMVEVWMLRIDKWPRSEGPRFILVEYRHRDAVVKDRELDNTVWRFEIRAAPPEKSGTCMSWWSDTFVPTALGANQKLPPPKELGCYLMQKRPAALRQMKAHLEKLNTPTTR